MKPAGLLPLLLVISAGGLGAALGDAPPAGGQGDAGIDYYALAPEQFFKRPETQARYGRQVVNISLLEAAVFQQTNIERVRHKLPVFRYSFALNQMAQKHSEEMAGKHYFSHTSPTPGSRLLVDRLRGVGLSNVSAAENIAVLPAREMGSGHFVIHENADGTESWTDAQTSKPILFDTYQEFAEAVLEEWMKSPEHRANILNRQYGYLGVGAARGSYGANHQDSIYVTQNFSSAIVAASEVKAQKELGARGVGGARGPSQGS